MDIKAKIHRRSQLLAVDKTDLQIAVMLLKKSSGFLILDEADRNVLICFIANCPHRVKSWLHYLKKDYNKRKSIQMDADKLYEELQSIMALP